MKDASRTLRLITTRGWRRKVMSEPPTMPQVPRFGISDMPVSRELTPAGTSAHSRLYSQVTADDGFLERRMWPTHS